MAFEYLEKYQNLTTEEIYDKAMDLAKSLNYRAAMSAMQREAKNWGIETLRDDLCLFLEKKDKIDEGNLIMLLTDF